MLGISGLSLWLWPTLQACRQDVRWGCFMGLLYRLLCWWMMAFFSFALDTFKYCVHLLYQARLDFYSLQTPQSSLHSDTLIIMTKVHKVLTKHQALS